MNEFKVDIGNFRHILAVMFSLICMTNTIAQLPNQNTYLLKVLDNYSAYSGLWGYTAPNGREYAILGTQTGTSFVDLTDSANIREVDFVAGVNSGWREMKTYSHYAYVVSEGTGSKLQIIDLQYLPDSVSLRGVWGYPTYTKTHSISQSSHYLYLNGGNATANGGVTVVNVIDPINPVKLGQWGTEYVHDCRVLNDTIWAANIYSGKMTIINASNQNNLQTVRSWQAYPTATVSTHNSAITSSRSHIFTTNEITNPAGRLYIWDIQDLENITRVGEWQPTGISNSIVHNVEIYGDLAIVAHYTAGIRILDISNPSSPVEVAWYDTYPNNDNNNFNGCWGVYKFSSGKIIGSDMSSGLVAIKTTLALANSQYLDVKIAVEGLLEYGIHTSIDSLEVKIKSSVPPFATVYSQIALIDSLTLVARISPQLQVGNYYIVIGSKNSLETWSRPGGEPLGNGNYFYDFTTSASQAYGNNMVLKDGLYCIYSGNVNGDNVIDAEDLLAVDNAVFNYASGTSVANLNGDNIVDIEDMAICDNNARAIRIVERPGSLELFKIGTAKLNPNFQKH